MTLRTLMSVSPARCRKRSESEALERSRHMRHRIYRVLEELGPKRAVAFARVDLCGGEGCRTPTGRDPWPGELHLRRQPGGRNRTGAGDAGAHLLLPGAVRRRRGVRNVDARRDG